MRARPINRVRKPRQHAELLLAKRRDQSSGYQRVGVSISTQMLSCLPVPGEAPLRSVRTGDFFTGFTSSRLIDGLDQVRSCEWAGASKIAFGELPTAARFLQVRFFELHHDLTWITRPRPNEGSLTAQIRNWSDISLTTQHDPISELA